MSRFYEWSDKGKGGWRAEREGEVEDRGRGDRDEFTVYNTRLDSVQERFFFFFTFEMSVSRFYFWFDSLSSRKILQKLMGMSSISGRNQVIRAGRRRRKSEGSQKKRPCKSRQFVMVIHKTIFSLASNQKRVDSNDLANYEQFTSTSEITINTHEFQRVASNWLQWCCKFNTMDRSTKAPRN